MARLALHFASRCSDSELMSATQLYSEGMAGTAPTSVSRSVYAELKSRLAVFSAVTLLPPTDNWNALRIEVRPKRACAAPVDIWEDDGSIAISAGKSARFDLEDPDDKHLNDKVVQMVMSKAEGKLIERLVGGLSLEPETKVRRVAADGHLNVAWSGAGTGKLKTLGPAFTRHDRR